MSKNVLLLSLTVLLLGATYLIKSGKLNFNDHLFESEELSSADEIRLGVHVIVKDEETKKWYFTNPKLPVNNVQLKRFFVMMESLQMAQELDSVADVKAQYQFSYRSGDDTHQIKILSFSPITGRLRLMKDNEVFLVSMHHPADGVYLNEQSLFQKLYDEFIKFFEVEHILMENHYIEPVSAKAQKLHFKRGQEFYIDLASNTTDPSVISALLYKENMREYVNHALDQLQTLAFIHNPGSLKNRIAEIKLDGKPWLTLYNYHQGKDGSYIQDHRSGRAFKVHQNSLDLFFLRKENFWKLEIFADELLSQVNALDLVLSQGGKEVKFHIPNTEEFKIETKSSHLPKTKELKVLFAIFFSVGDFKNAYSVHSMKVSEIAAKSLMVEILKTKFYLWSQDNFINVYDIKAETVYRYLNTGQIVGNVELSTFVKGL